MDFAAAEIVEYCVFAICDHGVLASPYARNRAQKVRLRRNVRHKLSIAPARIGREQVDEIRYQVFIERPGPAAAVCGRPCGQFPS